MAAKPDDSLVGRVLAGELLAKIRKKHGSHILQKASDVGLAPVFRIPSGIFPLDYGLGGGWPVGRVNLVYGHKSSSKTSTILRSIGNAQKMCANCWTFPDFVSGVPCHCEKYRKVVCSYIDVEGVWDAAWATALGVNVDELILCVPEYAEQALDIADSLVRSGDCDVMALDSIAALTPAAEIEESVEKGAMGAQSRIVGCGIRKLVSGINAVGHEKGRRPTVFLTNQIRMKIGVMFGNPETTPGGFAPGFAASVEVRCSPGKYEMDENTDKPLSVELRFKIEKNKTSPAKMEGDYKMVLAATEVKAVGAVLDEDYIVKMGERVGLIVRGGTGGAGYNLLGDNFSVKSLMEKRLMTDAEFKGRASKALMAVLLST